MAPASDKSWLYDIQIVPMSFKSSSRIENDLLRVDILLLFDLCSSYN